MAYTDAGEVRETRVPAPFERALKVLMSPETHADVVGFTLLSCSLAPRGGCTDTHVHDDSGELMVCVRGNGKAWLSGEEHDLKPGVAMYAPAGVSHRTLNTGEIPLELVCVFVPPAPADYVKRMLEEAGQG